MANSAWTANLPNDVLYDAGVLTINGAPFAVTRGGYTFDPGIEWRTPDYDGARSAVVGLDRIVAVVSKLSATFLQFGPTDVQRFENQGGGTNVGNFGAPQLTVAQAAALTAAQAAALTASAIGVPEPSGQLIDKGRYLSNVALVFARGSGGTASIIFDYLLCTKWSLKGNDKAEGEIAAEFEARLDLTTKTTDDRPYRYAWT